MPAERAGQEMRRVIVCPFCPIQVGRHLMSELLCSNGNEVNELSGLKLVKRDCF